MKKVVKEKKKEVVEIKWKVREMEERYRKMQKVGVRNIEGLKKSVGMEKKKGEKIERKVKKGLERNKGEEI